MSQFTILPPAPPVSIAPNASVNLTQVGGSAISEGQKTMATSLPVVIASDQSSIAVTASSLPLPSGAATSALQTTGNSSLSDIDASTSAINTKTPSLGQALAAASVPVVLTAAQISTLTPLSSVSVSNFPATQPVSGTVAVSNFPATQPVSGTVAVSSLPSIPAGANAIGSITNTAFTANAGTNLNTSALALESGGHLASIDTKVPALGQALAAASVPVVLTAAQLTTLTPLSTVTATIPSASTSTLTNVASSASSVSILASNTSAKGRFIFNDSTAILYLKFGTTASTTSYTVQIAPNGYYEFPANPSLYNGACDGIWSAANGSARVTELS